MGKHSFTLTGAGVSPGIAIGQAVLLKNEIVVERRRIAVAESSEHVLLLRQGLAQLIVETELLMERAKESMPDKEADIMEAHLLMLKDPALYEALIREITQAGKNAAWAVEDTFEAYIQTFENIDDEYMRQRSADLTEIRRRLLAMFSVGKKTLTLRAASIIIAGDLGPAEILALDRSCLAAVVLEKGGRTGHTAILARALGIPAVIGVTGITGKVCAGEQLIVDAHRGQVYISPGEDVQAAYTIQIRQLAEEGHKLRQLFAKPAVTLDGRSVELWANVGGIAEAKEALGHGAQGIGLFRTELLYMGRPSLPTEEEQERVYREMLTLLEDKPVVIRTLDIGADKPLPYFDHGQEENPALGYRAIRLCLQESMMFRAQLRALLKASTAGNLWIMFPMIATLEELRSAKGLLHDARKELIAEGHPVADNIRVGMMVEIPAAAVNADLFAPEVDFFSIGSNDLLQYLFAADRQNKAVDYLYQPLSCALLRLIRQITQAGHEYGIPVGICGEMAGDAQTTEALIGLGLDELSMSGASIPKVKQRIRAIETKKAAQRVDELIRGRTLE